MFGHETPFSPDDWKKFSYDNSGNGPFVMYNFSLDEIHDDILVNDIYGDCYHNDKLIETSEAFDDIFVSNYSMTDGVTIKNANGADVFFKIGDGPESPIEKKVKSGYYKSIKFDTKK